MLLLRQFHTVFSVWNYTCTNVQCDGWKSDELRFENGTFSNLSSDLGHRGGFPGTPEGGAMTEKVERYRQAARRESTQRRYSQALEHFEVTWGGFLPATSEAVARYLADYADTLATSTLRANLAALAKWHLNQGFVDPTKAPQVRDVLRGIQALHPRLERQAEPLQLAELTRCIDWLLAQEAADNKTLLQCRRDRALILLGFWRAFRSDDLCRLRVEFVQARDGEGMTLFLPSSKGDRDSRGQSFSGAPVSRSVLSRLD
jgi:hypothetical protein